MNALTSTAKAVAAMADDIIDLTPKERMIRKAKSHLGFQFGAFIVVTFALIAILAPLIVPHDPYVQNLSNRLLSPVWNEQGTWQHILGTDHLGRDYLS